MGFLDALSTVGDYFGHRFSALGSAYADSWTKNLPDAASQWWSGVSTMATLPWNDSESFGHGARLFMDGLMGVGTSLLGGTLGGAFEAPGLHETMWGLDKAYRYGIARPISWGYVNIANAGIQSAEAKKRGEDPLAAYMGTLFSKDTFIGDRGMWSEQIGNVTPGQAIIWAAGGLVGQLNPGNTADPDSWLRAHDPRTEAGQATFNSPESEFLLKYASGTIDLVANIGADPSVAAASGIKLAKNKFDHLATPSYIRAGGVEKEIGSKHYQRFYEAAKTAPSPEHLRWRFMSNARFGGSASTVLWTAAKISEDVFRDAYVVARGLDGLRDAEGLGAWDRLKNEAPRIASDFPRIFANWNIGEDSLMLGRGGDTAALQSLVLNDADAFVSAMIAREGIWGRLPGTLMMETQPKWSRAASLRAGVHTWAMDIAPVKIGRPLAKTVQTFLPSQGWTSFLDAEDSSALALRQFKANLERSGMAADRVEHWVSNWGAKGSREGRNEVFERAEEEAIKTVADRLGLTPQVVQDAMPAISRYRAGARQLITQQRVYISERAARLAAFNVSLGRAYEGRATKALNKGLSRKSKKGEFGDLYSVLPGPDGEPNFVPLPDTRKMPENAPDVNRPVLLSQTEPMIPTIDYRALEGQLKWYKRQHPVAKVVDAETGLRREPLTAAERKVASTTIRESLITPIAKLHSGWDSLITAGDFANVVWKSSALLRPAQTPRNLADDVLRRMLVFGKLPLIMSSMTGTKRVFQNHGIRGALLHDTLADWSARRGASKTRTAAIEGEVVDRGTGPSNELSANIYQTVGDAWKAGAISLDDFIYLTEKMLGSNDVQMQLAVPSPLGAAMDARDQKVFSTSERIEKLDPNATEAERKAWDAKKPPTAKIWHDRAFKRRIIEYYFKDALTNFLDDMRLSQVHRRSGEPLDPRHSTIDQRKIWLSQLINKHSHDRRGIKKAKGGDAPNSPDMAASSAFLEDPYRPAQMVVDPFTGDIPKDFSGLEDFTVLYHDTLDIEAQVLKGTQTGVPLLHKPSEKLLNFIVDNVDDLMKPDHLLSMSVMPDGNIRIGVARKKPAGDGVQEGPVKAGARHRWKNLKFGELKMAGRDEIKFYSHAGDETLTIANAFGGDAGQAMQHRVSAMGGSGSYNYIVGDTNQSRMLDQMGGWGHIRPGERGYAQSWERAVNAQLAGDPVARQFLEGKTDSDVVTWLESTADGTKYIHRMHYFGVNYVDHIRQIEAMVNEYVPLENSKAGRELRRAVLDRKANHGHLDAVRPDKFTQPEVHGASLQYLLGKGAIFDMMSRGIDNAQKLLSDMPTDKASRYPFFAEAYRRHLTDMLGVADTHALMAEDVIPVELVRNIEKQARDRALYDTKYRLYDVAQMNDLARLTRFIVPFSSAIMDSYIKYGRLVRDSPGVVLQGGYYWEMFERNEAVQDENGYVLKYADGPGGREERWYSIDPKTGERTRVDPAKVGQHRYIQFRLPSDLGHLVGKKYFGVDLQPVIAINKKSFNVFLDLPSAGPFVAVPANEFALSNPEFGESKVIQQFVLPFGPSSSRGKVFLPSTVRTAWEAFADADGAKAEGQAKAIFQSELIAYSRGERKNPPSFAEVRNRASMMMGLRFEAAFGSPLSFQIQSPYQPYIDAYHQLAAVDPEGADEAFLARYGEEFYAVAMTVTRNNASVRATLNSQKSFDTHKDIIAAYPELAGLIVGADGAGEFSKAVYETQKETPIRPGSNQMMREVMSLDESVTELEKRRVWQQYSKMQDLLTADMADMGLTTLRGARAKELKAVRDGFVLANKYWTDPATGREVLSPWYRDYTSVDHAAMDSRVDSLWQIVQDPNLQKRDDMRGLIDYLTLRERMQQEMSDAGVKTLTSKKAAALATKWQGQVFSLRERNAPFGALWNRWLSRDEELQLPTEVGSSAN